jgi:HlyD family secretion protein
VGTLNFAALRRPPAPQLGPEGQDVGAQPEDQVTWLNRDRPVGSIPLPAESAGAHIRPVEPLPLTDRRESAADSAGSSSGALGRIPKRWIAAAIVAALAAAVAFAVLRSKSDPVASLAASEGAIPLVTAVAPGLTSVTSSVSFTGTINARFDMPIGTEGETGRISAVYVEAGDVVHRGQLLAKLDNEVLRPQVDRLAASLEEARANASLADAQYARARGVASAGALSAEEIEKRRAAAVTAAAQVKVAEAQLNEYQARLSHTEIRAPADGIVLTRSAEVGQIATPGGAALFRLARAGEVEMRGQVAEQDLPALEVGQTALVHLTGIDRPFSGKVRLLGAIIDPQTRLGDIRVALSPDPSLRPGAFARAEVVTGRAQRPVLPQTAVLSDDSGPYVLIVTPDSRVERRAVRVGDTVPDGIVIASGLTGTERVVTTAAGFLRIGERINVAPVKASAS